ncbi:tyrosine-type recombinase/integrase [Desulfovibrio desulfuricans]|uniref:tyrosine-type recombinase/integrase n=1 Tax=Desulfovibrio desulfuricans TaxID=876 RepID=UPI001C01F75B|nr:site-specific integrase [Desulfovibrio desulfuricans]MBT9748537.1 tyrosine-type recombinase/integrase [Desulfovibrio desulfuricans]
MKLTKRAIEGLQANGTRYEVRDDDLKGFVVRVGVSGERSFYFVYRAGKGRAAPLKRLRLGAFPTMTVEQAREIAKQKAAQVALGEDPAEQVKEGKVAPTIKAALAVFFEQHDTKIKVSTSEAYHRIAEQYVIPNMGSLKVAAVQYRHVAALHCAMKETPYQANRAAALLSKFFGWCEKNGYRDRGSNPVAGLERYEEQKRKAFMGREELEALGNAFRVMETQGYTDPETGKITTFDPTIAAALKVMLFTGARCMEILTLKWAYIDPDRGIANLPDSKTGAKALHMPPPALAVLASLPRINEYCFPGRRGTGHIVNVKDTWRRLLDTARLTGWRIHDLRHAYASYAACSGKSLPVIGAILGHTQAATTARYAHLADNPVALAAAETAAQIQKDFSGGKVLPFKKAE